jgi:uncharacterized membrane protein YfcA
MWLFVIGVIVGIYSGIMGLGGGTIMIPIMVLILGFTQKEALGTSLAVMIPPVTLPAVIEYYRNGHVKPTVAIWIALGVLPGAFLGGYIANQLGQNSLKMIFGFVLVYVAGYTILGKEHIVRTMLLAGVLVIVAGAMFGAARWYDGPKSPSDAAPTLKSAQ